MSNKINVSLNFANLLDRGLVGIRRAAAFVALGQRAWTDESIKSVTLQVPMGFQVLPDPLPDQLANDLRSTFRTWLCGAAISELILGLSTFADEYFQIATYLSFKNGKVTQEGLTSIQQCKNDTNLASKLSRISRVDSFQLGLLDHANGWSLARNAFAHHHGIVRERDCTPGRDCLIVSWRQFEFQVNGEKVETIIGLHVEANSTISFTFGSGQKTFAIGERLEFSEQEITNVCLTAFLHVQEMVTELEKRANSVVAASNTDTLPSGE
jgi:hypothetical protein